MRQQFEPETVLMAHLEAQEWQMILAALRRLPYESVVDLIPKLAEQLTNHPSSDS